MKKITYLFAIAAMALTLGSCTDDEPKFNPAPAVEELPVFFSYEDNTEIELFENSTEIDIPVYRKSTEGALTLPVNVEVTPDKDGLTFPASVTFADGENEAHFIVGLDMTKIKGRTDYNMTVSIADGIETPYYTEKVTYKLNYSPWVLVTSEDGTVTKALYRDDIIAPLYGLEIYEYEVEMQANPENTNIVRLVDPYGPAWPYSVAGDYDDSEHHYMYFNITNPNAVFLCDSEGVALGQGGSDMFFHTGITLTEEGEVLISSEYNYYLANGRQPGEDTVGKIAQGNLTYGVDKLMASFTNDDGLYYGNRSGKFRVIWPGAEPYVDPMTVWNEIGIGQFTDGIVYPVAIMEEGSDEDLPTYDVTVTQFAGNTNLYRIMNPWKAGVCPYGIDYTGDKYIEIDCTDPDCVLLDQQNTGVALGGLPLYIMNYATYLIGNGQTNAEIIAAGVNDTFKNGVVYSAPGNLLWGLAQNGQISLSRSAREWQLVMPESPAAASAKNMVSANQFNGNGPLNLTPAARARNAQASWAVSAPVFSYATKTLKR